MRRSRWLLLLLLARFAVSGDTCGPPLNQDPEFDLWCGDSPCAWTVVEGRVERVPTWHRSDFGLSLVGESVTLSQTFEVDVPCLEVTLMVDRDADVELAVELDFFADGRVDATFPVRATGWGQAIVRSAVPPLDETVILRLRKAAGGKLWLARVRVDEGSGCGPAPTVLERDLGLPCAADLSCASGLCVTVCSECRDDDGHPCPDGGVCGVEVAEHGLYFGCGEADRHVLGERCLSDDECSTGVCAPRCPSGDCTDSYCSTCGDGLQGCPTGESCELAPTTPFGGPLLCSPGGGRRAAGEPCLADDDCASGRCQGDGSLRLCWDGRPCEVDADCTEGTCGTVGVHDGHCAG